MPALPVLQLTPKLSAFVEIAGNAEPAPPAAALAAAEQLLEPAFTTEHGDRRLAARSRSTLLQDPHAGAVLENALTHASAEVRASAAFELGRLSRPAALVPLLLRLKYERDPSVRVWVADALLARGCGAGIEVLLGALRDQSTADLAGQRAVEALRLLGADPGAAPTWDDIGRALETQQQRWLTAGALRDAGIASDQASTARLAALFTALQGFQLRPVDDARFVLSRAGKLGLPLLREAITASEPFLRTHALEVARDLGLVAQELNAAVLPLLADPLTRIDAARALGAMRARAAVPHLTQWLLHGDLERRTAAAWALGPIGDRATLSLLQARMADAREALDVRVMAAASVALFELDRPAYRFLTDLRRSGGYHDATLAELIDRIDRWR